MRWTCCKTIGNASAREVLDKDGTIPMHVNLCKTTDAPGTRRSSAGKLKLRRAALNTGKGALGQPEFLSNVVASECKGLSTGNRFSERTTPHTIRTRPKQAKLCRDKATPTYARFEVNDGELLRAMATVINSTSAYVMLCKNSGLPKETRSDINDERPDHDTPSTRRNVPQQARLLNKTVVPR